MTTDDATSGARQDLPGIPREAYEELRRLAGRMMQRERADHTLQPTALLHEALLRLCRHDLGEKSPEHRGRLVAVVMRRLLVDHSRARNALKRPARRWPLEELDGASERVETDFEAVDKHLQVLAELYPRQAEVVHLRFFGGLTDRQIAGAVGVSIRTVVNDWAFARSWLMTRLRGAVG